MGHNSGSNYFPKTQPSSYYNNNRQEGWCGYEVKYPDYEDEKIDWGPLWNAINFTATSSDAEFQKDFSRYFEQANIVDYYLFIELMLATDNHGKNMFFYNYDQLSETVPDLIGVAPWDLDGTWGRRWDGNSYLTGAQQDFTNFLWAYEHGTHTIFHRLDQLPSMRWSQGTLCRTAREGFPRGEPATTLPRLRQPLPQQSRRPARTKPLEFLALRHCRRCGLHLQLD